MFDLKVIKNIFLILGSSDRKKILFALFLQIIYSITELIIALMFIPLVQFLFNKNKTNLIELNVIGHLDVFTYLIIILVSYALLIYSFGITLNSSFKVGGQLTIQSLKATLNRDYTEFLELSANKVISIINNDINRYVNGVLIPGLQLFGKLVTLIIFAFACALIDFKITLFVALGLFLIYLLIYKSTKYKLAKNAKILTTKYISINHYIANALHGIKDIKIFSAQNYFNEKVRADLEEYNGAQFYNNFASVLSKYLIELFILIGGILFLIYHSQFDELENLLPKLTFFAMAGQKLLPAGQQIFNSITIIKSNLTSVDSLNQILIQNSFNTQKHVSVQSNSRHLLKISQLGFSYQKQNSVLNNINFDLNYSSHIGLIGKSGAGKSTLIDIILGLKNPTHGFIEINKKNEDQTIIALASSNSAIFDLSIKDNIVLGRQFNNDNYQKALTVVDLYDVFKNAHITDSTILLEKGSNISAGQRQRIIIARAIYENPALLIMDEVTNSLDLLGEQIILGRIKEKFPNMGVIVIGHRKSALQTCDVIHYLSGGQIIKSFSKSEFQNKDFDLSKLLGINNE